MPSLQKLYNDYKNTVEFVFITSENPQEAETFMQKRGYDFPVFYNERNLPNALYSKSIPTTFLISPEGRIIIKKTGAADWYSSTVREILNTMTDKF